MIRRGPSTLLLLLILTMPFNASALTQVTLAWDENNEAELAGYRLYMRVENGEYDFDNPEWQGTETHCIVPELDEHTVYYFTLRAFDKDDVESGDSNEVRFSYTAAPPAAIDNGTVTSVDSAGSGGCFIGGLMIP